jgi:peptidoglycan-N-acetylglucosamine deacetylase
MSAEQREKLGGLYGKASDGFRTLKPHLAETSSNIVELPVTTFPLLKSPIHVSYLMYLLTFSAPLAKAYWMSALTACRLTGTQPSLLLHPLDFLSGEEVPELRFFPGMSTASQAKIDMLDYVIDSMVRHFDIVTMREHVRAAGLHLSADDRALNLGSI